MKYKPIECECGAMSPADGSECPCGIDEALREAERSSEIISNWEKLNRWQHMTRAKSDLPPYVVNALYEFQHYFHEKLVDVTPFPDDKPTAAKVYQKAMDDISEKLVELMTNLRLRDYPSDVTASTCSATGDLLRQPVHEDENSPF